MERLLKCLKPLIQVISSGDQRNLWKWQVTFFLRRYQANNLITNPPYGRKILDLVKHCLTLADQKICLLLRLAFLEAQSRYVFFKEENTLEKVYVFSKRVIMLKEGEPMTGSKMAFAWFIWNKQYKGKPFIDWLF